MKRLDHKAAIVTGAGSGIGEAIAHKFAYEGASVLLAGLPGDPVEEVAAAVRDQYPDVEVAVYVGDVGTQDGAEACVAAALDAFGKLDVLVNNAGVFPVAAEAQEYPVEAYEQIIHNNVDSVFYMTRAALPALQKQKGNVVSAGSESGWNGGANFSPYGASKAFVHGFMKGVAVEQAPYGVRANCVCPGAIDTAWTHRQTGPMDKEMENTLVNAAPMGRRGTPEEMANVYAFLASDEASYVTGALWLADGGVTIAHGMPGEKVPKALKEEPAGRLRLAHAMDGYESEKPTD